VSTISVIIPLYNKEFFIEETINSVLNQTRLPDELIIIDDFSTDLSFKKVINCLKEHPHKVITKILKNKKNEGPSFTRNIGIESSSSDFLIFLDADDKLNKDYIETISRYLLTNPDIILCQTIYSTTKKIKPNLFKKDKDSTYYFNDIKTILNENIINIGVGNIVAKRKYIDNCRFDSETNVFEDWLFWHSVFAQHSYIGNFIYLKYPGYIYNDECTTSLSRSKDIKINSLLPPKYLTYLEVNKFFKKKKLLGTMWLYNCLERSSSKRESFFFVLKYWSYLFHFNIYAIAIIIFLLLPSKILLKIKKKVSRWT